jgi:hypothetical protein
MTSQSIDYSPREYEFPPSFEDQKESMRSRLLLAKQAILNTESYYDLGGGLYTTEEALAVGDSLYDIVKVIEPSDIQLIDAFEHFDIVNLLVPGKFYQMNERDQVIVGLYFGRYMTNLQSTIYVYRTGEVDKTNRPKKRYSLPKTEDSESRVQNIETFLDILRKKDTYQYIRDKAWEMYPQLKQQSTKSRLQPQEDFYILHNVKDGGLRPNTSMY